MDDKVRKSEGGRKRGRHGGRGKYERGSEKKEKEERKRQRQKKRGESEKGGKVKQRE